MHGAELLRCSRGVRGRAAPIRCSAGRRLRAGVQATAHHLLAGGVVGCTASPPVLLTDPLASRAPHSTDDGANILDRRVVARCPTKGCPWPPAAPRHAGGGGGAPRRRGGSRRGGRRAG